ASVNEERGEKLFVGGGREEGSGSDGAILASGASNQTLRERPKKGAQEGRASRASNQAARSVAFGASWRLEAIRSRTASTPGWSAMLTESRVGSSARTQI